VIFYFFIDFFFYFFIFLLFFFFRRKIHEIFSSTLPFSLVQATSLKMAWVLSKEEKICYNIHFFNP